MESKKISEIKAGIWCVDFGSELTLKQRIENFKCPRCKLLCKYLHEHGFPKTGLQHDYECSNCEIVLSVLFGGSPLK